MLDLVQLGLGGWSSSAATDRDDLMLPQDDMIVVILLLDSASGWLLPDRALGPLRLFIHRALREAVLG